MTKREERGKMMMRERKDDDEIEEIGKMTM